jgi:heme a synthase
VQRTSENNVRATHRGKYNMRSIRLISAIVAVETFFVLVLGKIVRVTGASESIPDWPLAYGRLVPQMSLPVFWEWTHRLLVLVVFVTMLALIIAAARLKGKLWLYCLMSLLMLLVPAAIGGLMFLYPPLHWTLSVTGFAFELLFFASVLALAAWSRLVDVPAGRRSRD